MATVGLRHGGEQRAGGYQAAFDPEPHYGDGDDNACTTYLQPGQRPTSRVFRNRKAIGESMNHTGSRDNRKSFWTTISAAVVSSGCSNL